MTAIVFDPANSNILYAGTAGGGVFKSSDGGANWSQFNGGLGNLDVRVLAVAPGSRHTLYAGTSGGVFGLAAAVAWPERRIARLARILNLPVVTSFMGRGLLADSDVPLARAAALMDFCHVLLNSNEFLYVN